MDAVAERPIGPFVAAAAVLPYARAHAAAGIVEEEALMTTPAAPPVECQQHHPTIPVTDVLAAADFYTKALGFQLGFTWGDPPTMVGVNLGGVSMHLTKGTPNPAGCSVYFVVGDADALFEFQRANGVEIVTAPGDRPWGLRDYKVRDRDGYELGFGHRLPEGPPLEIERVEVPVRLEKRLLALLHDLAVHKRMSLSGCLEEIVLHSFEPVGDAAASPHTKSTFRFIEALKRKHGIDYDAHAAYRFVER
jgi:catechol 2,3-dioxygenase-like lactoylglutathione lyase family enzyme